MKLQGLLLFTLLVIFVIQVQAHYDDYDDWEHDFPDSCEELFKTNKCNNCQSLMWDHFQDPGPCATTFNLGIEIFKVIKDSGETPKPYDLKFLKKGLNNYCHKKFTCSQNEAEKIYNKIQDVCKNELSVKFNWSDDPRNFDDITAYAAYGTLLTYYFGVPGHEALCDVKSNNGGYCSFEFVEKLNDFIKEKTNADPKAIVTHDLKFVITGSGKKIRIPRKFFCDQCWRKMAHIYVDYVKDHRLKKSVEENIWGNHHDLEELYLPNCKNSKRGLGEILNERREINKLSERSANPGFGAFSPRMNKLHSLRFR